MPLVLAPHGETMQIVKVCADGKLCRHLEDLGIVSGADIMLLSDTNGNMIVRVNDSRLALDSSVARSIVVKRKTVTA
ncbi:MAG: ferrous iron transport protein A [Clostridiales bacterium]|nr:ferrous iron transport protein A [Clostridiales bacterium]